MDLKVGVVGNRREHWDVGGVGNGRQWGYVGALGLGMHVDVGVPCDMKYWEMGNTRMWEYIRILGEGEYQDMGGHWVLVCTWT